MHVVVSSREVNVANKNVSIKLWHKRLGHLSQKGLEVLARKNVFLEITCLRLETCIDCLVGKQHRVAFHLLPPEENLSHWNWCILISTI